MVRIFLVRRFDRGVDTDVTGIKTLDQPSDRSALARGIRTFDDNDHAVLGVLEGMLQLEQSQMAGAEFFTVFLRGVGLRLVEFGEADRLAGGSDGHGFTSSERLGSGPDRGTNTKNPAGLGGTAGFL